MNGGALDPSAIRAALATGIGPRLAGRFDPRVLAETRSTNDDALALGLSGAADGTVVLTEHQTAGRGRRGDAWVSPPGTNLLFSLLLQPQAAATAWTRIPHLAGLAVCRAIETLFPALPPARLKWPNDVYLDDRKLAGILVESRSAGGRPPYAVLGIGLNVNGTPEEFPSELRSIATSLREHTGHLIDRNALAAAILAEWAVVYPAELASDFDGVRRELIRRSWLWGRAITVVGGGREITGTVVDLGPEGELVVEAPNGERESVVSAERVLW
jgi:BirA family biotin operon repressor/biotin-[acetyl-CoA-carboxylase] ligase